MSNSVNPLNSVGQRVVSIMLDSVSGVAEPKLVIVQMRLGFGYVFFRVPVFVDHQVINLLKESGIDCRVTSDIKDTSPLIESWTSVCPLINAYLESKQ